MQVARHLGISYEDLWELFRRDCSTMQVDPAILRLLSTLRDRYLTILITGNMDSFSRFTVPALGLTKYFDYLSNSYYERMHKVDNKGELFKRYAQLFNVPIECCTLLDDNPSVCNIFTNLGGKAYRVTPEKDALYHLMRLP